MQIKKINLVSLITFVQLNVFYLCLKVGDLMMISDHIDLPGLTGECVLIGHIVAEQNYFSFYNNNLNNMIIENQQKC